MKSRIQLGILLYFLSFKSYSGAIGLSQLSPVRDLFSDIFNSIEGIENGSFQRSSFCQSIPFATDDSFCSDPLAFINDREIQSDLTGRSFNSSTNIPEMQEFVRTNYSNQLEQAIGRLLQNENPSIQQLNKDLAKAFPREETRSRCTTELVIAGIFNQQHENSDYFTNNCPVSSMENLNEVVNNSHISALEESAESNILKDMQGKGIFNEVENFVFPRVKAIFQEKIVGSIQDPQRRARAQEVLDRIVFDYEACNESYGLGKGQAKIELGSRSGPLPVCLSSQFVFSSTSLFQIVHTLGHEIGHAFDECSRFCKSHGEWPREAAINNTLNIQRKDGQCSRVGAEAMADTFATEIQFEYFKNSNYSVDQFRAGMANTFFNLIGREDLTSKSPHDYNEGYQTHPLTADRYRMYFMHPGIRELAGCSSVEGVQIYE